MTASIVAGIAGQLHRVSNSSRLQDTHAKWLTAAVFVADQSQVLLVMVAHPAASQFLLHC
jgi:hypothetical protein